MSALLMDGFGGPDVLKAGTVPRPIPGDGEVLVRVATVGVNRQDTYTLSGRANIKELKLPHIPGNDPAGVIVATGRGVSADRIGERIVVKPAIACGTCDVCRAGEDSACARLESIGVHRPGGFAEYVVVPDRNALLIPASIDFASATALSQSGPVALHMLRDRALTSSDDIVLVTSAAGAIGAAAVQIARTLGATVIAAARGPERTEFVRNLGIDHVIDYEATPDFAARVREIAPDGVSVYVESAGAPAIWSQALKSLGRGARVVVCGSHAGPIVEIDLNWLFRMRVSIIGSSGSTLESFHDALALAAAGDLRPNIDSIRPLAEARSGFDRIIERQNRGKVVLRVADDDAVLPS